MRDKTALRQSTGHPAMIVSAWQSIPFPFVICFPVARAPGPLERVPPGPASPQPCEPVRHGHIRLCETQPPGAVGEGVAVGLQVGAERPVGKRSAGCGFLRRGIQEHPGIGGPPVLPPVFLGPQTAPAAPPPPLPPPTPPAR